MVDPAREHCTTVAGQNGVLCNYCNVHIKGGGITRFKYHLSGTDPSRNVKKCTSCPPEVQEQMIRHLHESKRARVQKRAANDEVGEELRDQVLHKGPVYNVDDDTVDPMPQSDVDLIRALRQSREEEAARRFMMGSGPSGIGGTSGTQVQQEYRSTPSSVDSRPVPPSLYKSSSATQKRVSEMTNSTLKNKLGRFVSKFFIYDNVPAHKTESHHFKNMMAAAQESGPGVPLPTRYEVYDKYLPMEHADITEYVNNQRARWKEYGCTIMSDGWTGPTRLNIINFMVYCAGHTIFLKSVDSSDQIKDHKYIYGLLKEVIRDVGKENVVHVVTDNESAFKKAGELLFRRMQIRWTPCAAHCIDLMFEDIGKQRTIFDIIVDSRKVTRFLYNHNVLLAYVRQHCTGEIVRPGLTRFATNYLALKSLSEQKRGLKSLFTSQWWNDQSLSGTNIGRVVQDLVLQNSFWERVHHAIRIYEPMFTALRLMDTEVIPTLGLLYRAFDVMKTSIGKVAGTQWVLNIIQGRWDKQMGHPLHFAGIFYLQITTVKYVCTNVE